MIIKKHILKRAWNYKQLGSMNNYLSSFLADSDKSFLLFLALSAAISQTEFLLLLQLAK